MIHIAVSAQRVFVVLADLARTASHFRDFGHTLDCLAPHLRLAATYARDQYRMLYSVTEAGVYRVAFYCDIQVQYDEVSQILHVTPLKGVPPVATFICENTSRLPSKYASRVWMSEAGAAPSCSV